MSTVTDNNGKLIEVADLTLPADYVYNFVTLYRGDKGCFPTDWSLDRCFRHIVDHGMTELKRLVKTKAKTAENKAAGEVIRGFGMTPAEAAKFIQQVKAIEDARLAEAARLASEAAKADAAKASSEKPAKK